MADTKNTLIYAPLLINLVYFMVGVVFVIDPTLISNQITTSAPGGYVFNFNIGALVFGLMAAVIGLSFIGVKVLGSGLSDTTVSIINRAVVYFLLWSILSTVSFSFLSTIPTFGTIIYGSLSLFYGIGVFSTMADIGGSSPAEGSGGGSDE